MRIPARSRPVFWCFFLASFGAAVAAGAETKLPPLRPLPPAIASKLDTLTAATTAYRGLALEHKVEMGQVDMEDLRTRITAIVDRELPDRVLAPVDRLLTDFGLLPADYELTDDYPELLTSQVAGFYDPREKTLVLTDRPGGLLGPEMSKRFGPKAAARIEEMATVHELTHAIQDQHFPLLGRISGEREPLADSLTAATALCEGDASLVMYSYLLGIGVERLPMIGQMLAGASTGDPARRAEMLSPFPGIPGAEQLTNTPAYLRESLVFPYLQGFVFALAVRQKGGQKLLDYAFAQDPPSSSEQLLHPEKWLETRDQPTLIALEPAVEPLTKDRGPLAGYRATARGSHGELGVNLWLTARLGNESWQTAETAAAGWGGDSFLYLETDSRPGVIAWVCDWDTVKDADEFATAAERAPAAAGRAPAATSEPLWRIERPSPTRVTLIRGALEESVRKELAGALANAPAEVRPGPSIDLQALGIGYADLPRPPDQEELMQLLNNPLLEGVMSGGAAGGAK